MPSLSSFISSNQYSKENLAIPFVAAMKVGSTYTAPVFNGVNNATSVDPGGLFGWLIYSRGNSALGPVKGLTSDQFIVYTNPSDLVQDLNKLSGITNCLLAPVSGSTYALFVDEGSTKLLYTRNGEDFLNAISYMAYGGTLVLTGSVAGFNSYLGANSGNLIDCVIDPYISSDIATWVAGQEYAVGFFPSIRDSASGVSGNGYTMANFASLGVSNVAGSTQGIKFFNLYGLKTNELNVELLKSDSTINYTIPAVSDLGGFFARAKNRNEQYLTIAGLDRATVLNGSIINPIEWSGNLKNYLRSNKVNFFVNYIPKFLGSDLVGATAATGPITVNDRIGPARLRSEIINSVNTVAFKYIFEINNQTTRDQVVSEVQTALDTYASYLDTTATQIICNESNNTDPSQLKIDLVVKPLLGTDSFVVNFTYTQ